MGPFFGLVAVRLFKNCMNLTLLRTSNVGIHRKMDGFSRDSNGLNVQTLDSILNLAFRLVVQFIIDGMVTPKPAARAFHKK